MAEEKKVSIGTFDCTLNVSTTRGLKISGYILEGDDFASISGRIDLVQRILDRQQVRADLIAKRAEVEARKANLREALDQRDRLAEKLKSGNKLATMERTTLDNLARGIVDQQARIDSLTAAIAAAEKELVLTE